MINLPVYFDLNGIHQISLFTEQDDGSFRRSMEQPVRTLRDNIIGISTVQGQLVAARYYRGDCTWTTPTIEYYSKSYSYYQFMRERLQHWKFPVFTCPSLQGRLIRFDIHELILKPGVSRQVLSLLSRKFVDALQVEFEAQGQREATTITPRVIAR